MYSVETTLGSLPGLHDATLSHDAGHWQQQLPGSPAIMSMNHHYTYNHSATTSPLCCFSLLGQHSINSMRYSTLYYKIGFVLDGFVQLWANVRVPVKYKFS